MNREPVRVKICGVTTPTDAIAIAEAGADWIGLNFHPPSPRHATANTAAAIVESLPPGCEAVGLFVDQPPSEVRRLAERIGLSIVQLHGAEPPEDLHELRGLRVVKAFRLSSAADIDALTDFLSRAEAFPPEAVLLDAFVPGLAGGTGRLLADDLLSRLPRLPRLILAGGLTPENVAERIARVGPWMVDVASGVESHPGRKDMARVRAFIKAVRSTDLNR